MIVIQQCSHNPFCKNMKPLLLLNPSLFMYLTMYILPRRPFSATTRSGPVHTKPISWRNRKGLVRFGLPSTRSRRIRWPKPQTSETTLGGGFKSTRFRFGFVCTPETDWNRKPWRHRPTPRPPSQWLLSPRSLRNHNKKDDGGLQACNRSAAYHVPCWVAKPLFIENLVRHRRRAVCLCC